MPKCDLTGRFLTTHGLTKSKEYGVWNAMKQRCYNKNHPDYKEYGGRGIKVCKRWLTKGQGFQNFYKDMGPRPGPNYSIEREDNNGNYTPKNCYWATPLQQQRNTRKNDWIEFNGKKMILSEWAREANISASALFVRLRKQKWSIEKALTFPLRKYTKNRKS